MSTRPRKHLIIPDTQIRPGVPLDHLNWIANYAVEKRPDVIVILGDWWDMPSLSSYDIGKKSYEGRTYSADIEAGNDGLSMLMGPIQKEIRRRESSHKLRWNPELEYREGNHENRVNVAIENDRKLEGTISTRDMKIAEYGFNVLPFLKVGVVDGVAYCHYFVSGVMGKPITTAANLIKKKHMSCVAGHQQGKDIAMDMRGDGVKIVSMILGSCYLHDEGYLNHQSNQHWRGICMAHEVNDGSYDEMPVSLNFLRDNYA